MGDKHIGKIKLTLKSVKQLENALGDKLVKRACHLVTDDEAGLGGNRPGDADALFLAAR